MILVISGFIPLSINSYPKQLTLPIAFILFQTYICLTLIQVNIMIYRLLIFLVINFGALAIGGIFTGKGVPSEWYININKAPWTPPGWVFGVAWTSIMICFSIYLTYLWPTVQNKNLLIVLFIIQLILNIGWNPSFFYYNNVFGSLIIISSLTLLIGFILIYYYPQLKIKTLLIAPYLIWLIIATSLNAYIWLKN